MTWTYGASPATSTTDALRLLIGDTIATDPQMQDEELAYLALGQSPILAAAAACEALAARYARQADRTVGDISLSASQRSASYLKLAQQLRTRRRTHSVGMLVGGLSLSEKQAANQNSGDVQPSFARQQYDTPGLSAPTNDPTGSSRTQ